MGEGVRSYALTMEKEWGENAAAETTNNATMCRWYVYKGFFIQRKHERNTVGNDRRYTSVCRGGGGVMEK